MRVFHMKHLLLACPSCYLDFEQARHDSVALALVNLQPQDRIYKLVKKCLDTLTW